MVQPGPTRLRILEALRSHAGNARRAADALDCSYHTLWRIIKSDGELRNRVEALRKELAEQGVSQKGWERPS